MDRYIVRALGSLVIAVQRPVPAHTRILSALFLFLVSSLSNQGAAQRTGIPTLPPVQLTIEAPSNHVSTSQAVQVRLLDVDGKAAVAPQPIHFKVSAAGANVDMHEITIPKGASSASVNIKKDTPGLAHISVEQAGSSGRILSAGTQLNFDTEEDFVPKRPYSISLDVSPSSKILTGAVGTIVARLVDANNREFPSPRDYHIAFPELAAAARIHPAAIKIARNESFVTAQLSSSQVATLPFHPSILPPLPFISTTEKVDFISPIVSAVVIPRHSYFESTFPPKIQISVGLADGRNDWIASDLNRTVILKATPEAGGIFENNQIEIPKGQSVVQTFYTPLREGKVIIAAVAGGLQSPEMSIEFRYKLWFFLILAIIGGFCGGIVKRALEGQKQIKDLWLGALVGSFTGALAYLLAPALDLKTAVPAVQAGSRVFEAFLYGFLGGAIGFFIFNSLISGVRTFLQRNPQS